MENKLRKANNVLLPVHFKIIGLVVMILAFAPVAIVKSIGFEMEKSQKEVFRVLTLNAFILGLLFVACSRDKIEDEMTVSIRLKSMSWTFVWAVFYVIITPLIDLIFRDSIAAPTGQRVVMSMLFVYLIMYYVQKRSR
jgi:hypothetical protein